MRHPFFIIKKKKRVGGGGRPLGAFLSWFCLQRRCKPERIRDFPEDGHSLDMLDLVLVLEKAAHAARRIDDLNVITCKGDGCDPMLTRPGSAKLQCDVIAVLKLELCGIECCITLVGQPLRIKRSKDRDPIPAQTPSVVEAIEDPKRLGERKRITRIPGQAREDESRKYGPPLRTESPLLVEKDITPCRVRLGEFGHYSLLHDRHLHNNAAERFDLRFRPLSGRCGDAHEACRHKREQD